MEKATEAQAAKLKPVVTELREAGKTTVQAIIEELNRRGTALARANRLRQCFAVRLVPDPSAPVICDVRCVRHPFAFQSLESFPQILLPALHGRRTFRGTIAIAPPARKG